MNTAFNITKSGILLFHNGVQSQVPQDHPNFAKIKDALVAKQFNLVADLMDTRKAVKNWLRLHPALTLVNDKLSLNGEAFSDAVTDKVLNLIEAGNDANALYNFLVKVRLNPSNIAQNELLLFCVANAFMIHADGDILAYKSVREDYTDIHSGKFSNKVGTVNTMDRRKVDDVRERTCSHGLHFASYEYATTWTTYGHLMLLKINPRDVVSIPSDYSNQKGRTCRYEVIAELGESKPLPKKEVYTDRDLNGFDEVDGFDYEDEDEDCGCTCCEDEDEDEDFLDTLTDKFDASMEFERKLGVFRKLLKELKTATYWRGIDIHMKLDELMQELEDMEDEYGFTIPDEINDSYMDID